MYEYVDEDGNVIENPDDAEFEEVEVDEKEKEKEKKKKEKKDKKGEKKKKRGVKKTGKEKKGGKITKQYEDEFLKDKRTKKKKRTKVVQVKIFLLFLSLFPPLSFALFPLCFSFAGRRIY